MPFIVGAVLAFASVLLDAQPPLAMPPPDPSVPDLRYASSLVASEQPVGLVLMHDELHVAPRELWPHLAPDARRTTSATIRERDGFTLIESQRAALCRAAVTRRVRPMRLTGTILEIPLPLVTQDAGTTHPFPPSRMGARAEPPSSRSQERLDQHFDVEIREGDTLADALTRIVGTGIPFGWGVVEHDEGGTRCQLIFLTEDSVSWTPYDVARLGR